MVETFDLFFVLLILFLVVLAVLWFLLPFAVFGIKDRLDVLIRESQKTNELLRSLLANADTSKNIDLEAIKHAARQHHLSDIQ